MSDDITRLNDLPDPIGTAVQLAAEAIADGDYPVMIHLTRATGSEADDECPFSGVSVLLIESGDILEWLFPVTLNEADATSIARRLVLAGGLITGDLDPASAWSALYGSAVAPFRVVGKEHDPL